jgi:hypothetical protein
LPRSLQTASQDVCNSCNTIGSEIMIVKMPFYMTLSLKTTHQFA